MDGPFTSLGYTISSNSQGIAFAYYGGTKQVEILNMLRSKGANVVFYGCLTAAMEIPREKVVRWYAPSWGKLVNGKPTVPGDSAGDR